VDAAVIDDVLIDDLADRLWSKMVGANCSAVELNLRAKLALEARVLGSGGSPSFGLDRLTTEETASYIGGQAETLRDKHKRRVLGLPQPYHIGRKLFWRRSELDSWIETRREARKSEGAR
jgi:predicted DNA-binding transcriptional regulator AlpA